MASELSTTSYAVLGLLALRGWSTYELAEQMRRALGQFWPRAESGLYEEPKKLVAHGLARATREYVGRRPRTRYTITAQGRRALAAWVAAPAASPDPVLEFEPLVKVFFAEHSDKARLLETVRGVLTSMEDRAAANAGISHEYIEGRGPYPERLPWLILTGKLLDEFEQAVDRWARWAIETVEQWPEDLSAAEPDTNALAEMARNGDAFVARVAERNAGSAP
jgi:DNA-binding PadR family transcriptional regulator